MSNPLFPHLSPPQKTPQTMSYSAAVKSRHSNQPFPTVPQTPTGPPHLMQIHPPLPLLPNGNYQYHQIQPQPPQSGPQPPQSGPSSPQIPQPQRKSYYPDVYTQIFVPEALRAVNSMPATPVRAMPPPNIDYHTFITGFVGSSFLKQLQPFPGLFDVPAPAPPTNETEALSKLMITEKKTANPGAGEAKELALTPTTYAKYFSDLLRAEVTALNELSQTYNMYNVPLTIHDPTQHLFRLAVPGIRENTPMIQLGDTVRLRQIRPGCYGYPGCFTGYEYETFVFGMDKTEGYIVLRADGLWIEMGGMFNVVFCVPEQLCDSSHRAVTEVGAQLAVDGENANGKANVVHSPVPQTPTFINTPPRVNTFLRRMLFPEVTDGEMQYTAKSSVYRRKWFDKELNFEQQEAIHSILQQDYGNVPFLVSGPPGTGKTKTIVEAALQLIYAPTHPKHHILLCAPSQEAADTLALRLTPHLNPNVLFRLQTPARTFPEVPSALLAYCYVENDMFSIPSWKRLMQFRVVVCSCRDADILVQARCTNRDLGRWEKSVVDSLRGGSDEEIDVIQKGETVRLHWSVLLIDEAAQGLEPEVAIPLSVVAPPEEASNDKPIVVMAGDQRQLGPRTASKGALELSAFERLFARPLYTTHPLSRDVYSDFGPDARGKGTLEFVLERKQKLLPYLRPPFANLVRNYRSHAAILAVPSALFYNDTLIPEARSTDSLQDWGGWEGDRGFPIKLVFNCGLDESHEEGVSYYNLQELEIAKTVVQSLLRSSEWGPAPNSPLNPEEICVMSPFREQVKRLRKTFRGIGLKHVNVGPVEAFQGSEHRLVVICTTRARERFLPNDVEKRTGLINEHRRLNVAITRAKEGLIVIGNPWILERDRVWKQWMEFAWRHNGVALDPNEDADVAPKTPALSSPSTISPSSSTSTPLLHVGRTKPVNAWKPRGNEVETANFISRLESALVYKSKAREGTVFGLSGGWDEDDPMFLSGIEAEEDVMREMESEQGLGLGINL